MPYFMDIMGLGGAGGLDQLVIWSPQETVADVSRSSRPEADIPFVSTSFCCLVLLKKKKR